MVLAETENVRALSFDAWLRECVCWGGGLWKTPDCE